IRELANLVLRYVILESEDALVNGLKKSQSAEGRPASFDGISLKDVTRQAVHDLERRIILQALEEHNWNRKHTAEALHISYRALLYKIKEAGLPGDSELPAEATVVAAPPALPSPEESREQFVGQTLDAQIINPQ